MKHHQIPLLVVLMDQGVPLSVSKRQEERKPQPKGETKRVNYVQAGYIKIGVERN